MRRLFGRGSPAVESASPELRLEVERGRRLIEESPVPVVVVDERRRVIAASRRARETLEGLDPGSTLGQPKGTETVEVPYEIDGRRETLVYLGAADTLPDYEELRAGFTAAVSHELRTPLARLLALLETAQLPGADAMELVERARGEAEQIRELVDDILFLSELETGRAVVALVPTEAQPVLDKVTRRLAERAERAGVGLRIEGDPRIELPLRPRMLEVVAQNLAENAIRYAGPGATFTFVVEPGELRAVDDGVGVAEEDLPRLFERFYRADQARASRGTGLGLAIVKHIVTSAGGSVEAAATRGSGLTITCRFPAP
jgi:two-component system phosphate regulon sensor histidine kinase PhoR